MTKFKYYDLLNHPRASNYYEIADPKNKEIAIGDLHANPIKLLNLLISEGILDLPAHKYQRLLEIYLQFPEIKLGTAADDSIFVDKFHSESISRACQRENTKIKSTPTGNSTLYGRSDIQNLLSEYNSILNEITLSGVPHKLVLIGDELSDRGVNDYFMIKMLERIVILNNQEKNKGGKGFEMEIMASNHGFEFAASFLGSPENLTATESTVWPNNSLLGLKELIDNKVVTIEDLQTSIENVQYFKNIKLLSLSIDKTETGQDIITIFSHAPINRSGIYKLAKNLGVHYNESSIDSIVKTIDAINANFSYYMNLLKQDPSVISKRALCDNLNEAIWHRYADYVNEPDFDPGYFQLANTSIYWVHGHDQLHNDSKNWSEHLKLPLNIYCTDDTLGKGNDIELWKGYAMVFSEENRALADTQAKLTNQELISDPTLYASSECIAVSPEKSQSLPDTKLLRSPVTEDADTIKGKLKTTGLVSTLVKAFEITAQNRNQTCTSFVSSRVNNKTSYKSSATEHGKDTIERTTSLLVSRIA